MNNLNLAALRNEYKLRELLETKIAEDPLSQLSVWLDESINAALYEPTAMNLCTVSKDKPSSRILLLKGISESGLIFYSNYKSKKGKEIDKNPHGAITFFWPELERQVRIEGKIEKASEKLSDEYFQSRPRGSQLGAWVSPQSAIISAREELLKNKSELEKKYKDQDVPRPKHWGGYILIPDYFEFWQGRPDRLHDRISYRKKKNNWKIERLAP